MSTLSSWIDPAEISELMPFLLPQEEGEGKAGTEERAGSDPSAGGPEMKFGAPAEAASETTPEKDDVETSRALSAGPEATAGPIETIEVIDARNGVPSVPSHANPADSDPSVSSEPDSVEPEPEVPETNSEIDFDTPEAYDAAAFPEGGKLPDGDAKPGHQAAAVQAAVALERARNRADEVGLLKKNEDGAPTGEASEAKAGGESPMETPVVEPPVVVGLDEPSIPQVRDEVGDNSDSNESRAGKDEKPELKPEPGTFRYRMANFARNAVQLTGGSDPAVTDFQSYPLFPAANGNRCSSPESVDSILKMNRLIGEFPGRQNGDSESTTQIALAEGQWLCILTRDSASGGVCASLRVPEPVTKETAAQLHRELSGALAASPV